jgi:hypothetical protein
VRSLGSVDLGAYARAFVLLARNPQIVLAPLLAALANVLLFMLMPSSSAGFIGSINTGLSGLIAQLITAFGMGVALIVADAAWRRGRAPFDEAWDEARRKAGDILIAALGFSFIIYVAALIGSFIPFGSIVLALVALYFFIYTLPAAAIGGIPGGAALQVSLERARGAVLATLLITALYLFANFVAPTLILLALQPLYSVSPALATGVVSSLISAAITAVITAYVALVLAKTYADVTFTRRW